MSYRGSTLVVSYISENMPICTCQSYMRIRAYVRTHAVLHFLDQTSQLGKYKAAGGASLIAQAFYASTENEHQHD